MKTAVLLVSMGGPSGLEEVRPFLFNLFYDKAILRLPNPLRFVLALGLSTFRTSKAKAIYRAMGGFSPLLSNTKAQAAALEAVLGQDASCFVAMSYTAPFIPDVLDEIARQKPDRIFILPMYPQHSSTTRGSVLHVVQAWKDRQKAAPEIITVGSFYLNEGFLKAVADYFSPVYIEAAKQGTPRVLFSAHGLPQTIVDQGDPYPKECEETMRAVLQACSFTDVDARLCYQSKVGRGRWTGPSIDEEIEAAAKAKKPIVVVPLSFVCEHSETLVELDQMYRNRAYSLGAPFYWVVQTVGVNTHFISGLADEINQHAAKTPRIREKITR